MASRIEKYADEIHSLLNAALVAVDPTAEPPEKVFGRLAHEERRSASAISWIPRGGGVNPPKNAGGRLVPAGEGVGLTAERQNQIATRACLVEAWCWGGSGLGESGAIEATEQLLHNLLAAINNGNLNIELRGERWINQEDAAKAGWNVDGQVVIADLVFMIPVVGEVAPLVTITAIQRACLLNTEPE